MNELIITERSDIVAIADAVRSKTGTTSEMTLGEIASGISGINTSGAPVLQQKTVTPAESVQNVTADSGYDGLSKVTVKSIPDRYIVDDEVIAQDTLIANIVTALEGKAAGGSAQPVLQEKSATPTTSSQTITPDNGYDGLSKVTVSAMPTATQATPSISVNASGLITASATQYEGYVASGTKSATKQLTTQAAKTITPTTSSQTAVASGVYTTGDITVAAIPTATQATPSISVNSSGLITASATQSAGYVSAGTKSATKQLTTQAAKTVTPTESSQTAVASGVYTTGAITVAAIPDGYMVGNEISAQDSLISQITTALAGKAAGGGGGVETCTITITSKLNMSEVTYYYTNGNTLELEQVGPYAGSLALVVPVNSIIAMTQWQSGFEFVGGAERIFIGMGNSAYKITGDCSVQTD